MQSGAISPGQTVVVVDDVIATGAFLFRRLLLVAACLC
jgi:adenine/guanine phosphoribosyltransferase-like PRPP-binding protein